jgi:hypothetical protein
MLGVVDIFAEQWFDEHFGKRSRVRENLAFSLPRSMQKRDCALCEMGGLSVA